MRFYRNYALGVQKFILAIISASIFSIAVSISIVNAQAPLTIAITEQDDKVRVTLSSTQNFFGVLVMSHTPSLSEGITIMGSKPSYKKGVIYQADFLYAKADFPVTVWTVGGGITTTGAVLFSNVVKYSSEPNDGLLSGQVKQFHRIKLEFDGPAGYESDPGTFYNNFMEVSFRHVKSGKIINVPGHFAADGNSAETSSISGNKWRVYFSPPYEGLWAYEVVFRQGPDIAVSSDPHSIGSPVSPHGGEGSFYVKKSDKTGIDFRGRGHLRHVGGHYLQFSGSGEFFIKAGADSPENLLAFADFDNTQGSHFYAPHVADWKTGDPTWKGGKGKGIIGAMNYLSSKGMNSVYFLTYNIHGDGNDVHMTTHKGEKDKFDISKLDQWEIVFSHMDKLGLHQHFVTQETENDGDYGDFPMTRERKLYYRELISRFAHHPALTWNLGEENTNSDAAREAFAEYFKTNDPYGHPVVVHTYPGDKDKVYNPLLDESELSGPSMQVANPLNVHNEILNWRDKSEKQGIRRWMVGLDEIGPPNDGVKPDSVDPTHDDVRKDALWGALMAGASGIEWYFGYAHAHSDLSCEDWRSRDKMWDQTRHAIQFFQTYLPFPFMAPSDHLIVDGADYGFAREGQVYAFYRKKEGGPATVVNLAPGQYSVDWYNPRTGGGLKKGEVTLVTGGSSVSLGHSPIGQDSVALVRKVVSTSALNPLAMAAPITLFSGAEGVVLDGSWSTGDIVGYKWNSISGLPCKIENATLGSTGVTDLAPGNHKFKLTIFDSKGGSNSTIVDIYVE